MTDIALRSPWQPCVAQGWHQVQLKRPFLISLGKMLQNTLASAVDTEVPYLKAQHVQWAGVKISDLPTMWASPADIQSLAVMKGDLLVCEGGEVGRAAHLSQEPPPNTIIQNALHLVRGHVGGEPRFLAYLLRHAANQEWFDVLCNRSTISHFTVEKFGEMWAWLPTAQRQRAIADYLDRETALLDGLVAAKERVLGLLAEKRRAVIARAVTRGLDPRVPLRDSGIPWLGEIPAHWTILMLRYACAAIQTGGTPSAEFLDDTGTSGVDWFTPGDFQDSLELGQSVRKVAAAAIDAGEASLFPTGAVFVVGIGATLGKTGVISRPASANQQINALVPARHTDSRFLANLLTLLGDVMNISANSATLPILNQQRMGQITVTLPPLEEQRAIVNWIDERVSHVDLLRRATEGTIVLLRERRAALISAAVTGQVEVTGA